MQANTIRLFRSFWSASGVPVLNINDLANALKPAVLPGELLTIRVIKEGKEAGQGIDGDGRGREDVVGVAAELESEKLMQRVAYLNMCANIAPMLGLLGTVQGMIYAFANLATTQAGAAQQQHRVNQQLAEIVDQIGLMMTGALMKASFVRAYR